ncbi:hypothetical protein FACS189452_07970 [Bacteroidia bacterium]|nr:hypothetical protein FACS189452_07970 [Bacteroidia bacterium]GHT80523.1 hypothetical protein FACS189467_2890 [Bacteroidia bacterium]
MLSDHELLQSYAEALRYMRNAEATLQKSGKYVRTACGTAYLGVLLALDAWLLLKGTAVPTKRDKTKRHRSIDMYKYDVSRLDGKMLDDLNTIYDVLHLAGYYDGIQNVRIIREGFSVAYEMIEKIKPAIPDTELQTFLTNYKKPSLLKKIYMLLI